VRYPGKPSRNHQNHDINKSFNDAVAKVRELAEKGDPNACYALAHWGILSGANINTIAALYPQSG
jgi:hypothetical protein